MAVAFFFFNQSTATQTYTLSLHDALPIYSLSFETWFNAPVGSSGVILSQTGAGDPQGSGVNSGHAAAAQVGTDVKLRSTLFWHGDTNARIVSPGATTYNDGRWHHVAVSYA